MDTKEEEKRLSVTKMETHVPKCVKTCLCVQCCSFAVSKVKSEQTCSSCIQASGERLVEEEKNLLVYRSVHTAGGSALELLIQYQEKNHDDELIYIKMTKTLRKTWSQYTLCPN